jgi:hypothetical protein
MTNVTGFFAWLTRRKEPMTYEQVSARIKAGLTPEEMNLRGSDVARLWGVPVELYALAARDEALSRWEARDPEHYKRFRTGGQMSDSKILSVSASQVRLMAYLTTWNWQSPEYDENNLRRGRVMLRIVWLADLWPTWPYFVDDPDGRDFGDARHAMAERMRNS